MTTCPSTFKRLTGYYPYLTFINLFNKTKYTLENITKFITNRSPKSLMEECAIGYLPDENILKVENHLYRCVTKEY